MSSLAIRAHRWWHPGRNGPQDRALSGEASPPASASIRLASSALGWKPAVGDDLAVMAVDHRRRYTFRRWPLISVMSIEPLLIGPFGGEVPVDGLPGSVVSPVGAVTPPFGNMRREPASALSLRITFSETPVRARP